MFIVNTHKLPTNKRVFYARAYQIYKVVNCLSTTRKKGIDFPPRETKFKRTCSMESAIDKRLLTVWPPKLCNKLRDP